MRIKQILISVKSWIKTVAVASFSAGFLMGCTTAGNAIPQGGPTMAQVYEEAMQNSNGATIDQAREEVKARIALNTPINSQQQNTRTPENEINNLFPTLPNPQLVMYVYPHLAGEDETPVPGNSTAFSLYEKQHYSIFGENDNFIN